MLKEVVTGISRGFPGRPGHIGRSPSGPSTVGRVPSDMPWEAQAAGSWIGPLSSFPGQAPVFSPPRRAGCPKAWSRQAVPWPKLPLAPASLSPHRGRVTERCSPGAGHPAPWFPRKTRQRCHLLTGFPGGRNNCDSCGVPATGRGSFIRVCPLRTSRLPPPTPREDCRDRAWLEPVPQPFFLQ